MRAGAWGRDVGGWQRPCGTTDLGSKAKQSILSNLLPVVRQLWAGCWMWSRTSPDPAAIAANGFETTTEESGLPAWDPTNDNDAQF